MAITEIRIGFYNNAPVAAPVDTLIGELSIISGSIPPPQLLTVTPQGNLLTWQPPPSFEPAW